MRKEEIGGIGSKQDQVKYPVPEAEVLAEIREGPEAIGLEGQGTLELKPSACDPGWYEEQGYSDT